MEKKKPPLKASEILEYARAVYDASPKRSLKPRTEHLYRLTGQLYYQNTANALLTTSKCTYYLRRAALTFYASQQLKQAILDEDASQAAKALLVLAQFTSGVRSSTDEPSCPLEAPKRRASKRASLKGLPPNWRSQLIEATAAPALRRAVLLIAAAGIRPSEVVNGVHVVPINGGIRVTVRGAKTDRGHGQPLRTFEVKSELALQLGREGEQFIQIEKPNQLSLHLSRLGRRLFGANRKSTVSCYSLRHAFASDLKAAEVPSLEISAILGHSVSDTKQSYGHHSQGRMPISARLVHATRDVKAAKQQHLSRSHTKLGA